MKVAKSAIQIGQNSLNSLIFKDFMHNNVRYVMATLNMIGGSGEIRTHEQCNPSLVFKTSAFNHSATLPDGSIIHKAQWLTNG